MFYIINNIHGDTGEAVEKNEIGINYKFGCFDTYRIEKRDNARRFFENVLSKEAFDKQLQNILRKVNYWE